MTPVTPDQTPPDWGNSASEIAATAGKVLAYLAGLYASIEVIYKPFMEYRTRKKEKDAIDFANRVRTLLEPDLTRLARLVEREEEYLESNQIIFERQKTIFRDMGQFLEVSLDNRDRLDEQNELLDRVFKLDRRVNHDERKRVDEILEALRRRQQERKEDGDT